jgi:hypothetical protein
MQQIRIVAFKDGDFWVAQCLEADVSAQANDVDILRGRIEVALDAEKPLDKLPKAPAHFFEMWNRVSTPEKGGTADGIPYEMALFDSL